jgi:hypothetical protein
MARGLFSAWPTSRRRRDGQKQQKGCLRLFCPSDEFVDPSRNGVVVVHHETAPSGGGLFFLPKKGERLHVGSVTF